MEDEIALGIGRLDHLVLHGDDFRSNTASRIATNVAVYLNRSATDQITRLSAGGDPRAGQVGVESHSAGRR
ncbi:MAG: hypothetical protein VCB25_01245 [Myxococcota bacterium]